MATSMRTRLFADESKSLRSFRVNSQPLATPLSLKAASLKHPSPLSFHHRAQQPTILSHNDIICFEMGLPKMYVYFLILFSTLINLSSV
jgi:hypothetical protein